LTLTDPTGYGWWDDAWQKIAHAASSAFHAVGNAVTNALQNPYIATAIGIGLGILTNGLYWVVQAAILSAYSGVVTLANGGSLGDAMLAAGITFATAGIWHYTGNFIGKMEWDSAKGGFGSTAWAGRSAVHGIVGGGIQVAEGGSFTEGFLVNATSEALPVGSIGELHGTGGDVSVIAERTAAAGIIGGTVATAIGGNFANGAASAAIAELYNDCAHSVREKLAYLVERPLNLGTKNFPIASPDIYPSQHFAIQEDDGTLVGYFDDSRAHTGDSLERWYHPYVTKGDSYAMAFNNKIMSNALQVTAAKWGIDQNKNAAMYDKYHHNCHDFIGAAITEYKHEGGIIKWVSF